LSRRSAGIDGFRWRCAFTLIELLVVIAILVVLAALVFVIANGAMSAAKRTKCTSNLRQIGIGISSYVAEEGKYPGEELGVEFDVVLLPYLGVEPERTITGRSPIRKRRYPEIANAAAYFSCPLDEVPRDDRFYKRSYSIVPWATNWTHAGVSRGWLDRPPNTGVSASAVPDPSQAALVVEWHVEGNLLAGGSYVYADQGNSKHGEAAANTLFADGHIEAIPRISDFVQRYWPGRIGPAN
jgi:prepilin-type N-terminal cleavage/methylation domain-containing protein/prepilin-type processing-associated H-X9-DG protein